MQAETLARVTSARRITVVIAVLMVLWTGAVRAATITSIDVANKADRVVITVQGDSALSVNPIASRGGRYLGFQIPGHMAVRGRLVGIHGGRICNVRYSMFRPHPPCMRIVVNTSSHLDYSTKWSDDRHRVDIHIGKYGASPEPKPETKTEVEPAVKASVPALPAPTLVASTASVLPISAPSVAQEVTTVRTKAAPRGKPDFAAYARIRAATLPRNPEQNEGAGVSTAALAAMPGDLMVKAPEPTVRVLGMVEATSQAVPTPAEPVSVVDKPVYTPTTATRPVDKPVMMAKLPTASDTGNEKRERRVSLNFLGADINDVLKALSVQSGHNIVASKDVKGDVTVSLNSVTVREALDYVAKLSGYTYAEDNGTFLVAQKDKMGDLAGGQTEDTVTDIVSLRYINVDEVITLLKAQYPDVQAGKVTRAGKGRIEGLKLDATLGSQPNNSLVLLGARPRIEAAKSLVMKVDESMKTQAAEEMTNVYTVKYVSVPELAKTIMALVQGIRVALAPSEGFDLSAPSEITVGDNGSKIKQSVSGGQAAASSPSSGGGGDAASGGSAAESDSVIGADTKSRSLIVVGREPDVKKAMDLAEQLDIKSPQIKIEAKVTSISESGEKKLGVTWNWGEFGALENFTDFTPSTDMAPTPEGTNKNNVRVPGGKWFRQPFNIGAALEALITNGDGQLLASPNISCMEGKPAVFFVGDEVTYIQRIEVTPTGQNITTDTKQVGVQLRVVAKASADGFITLNLHPEVSVLKLSVEQGITLPIVTRRFTDHVVRVRNGDTIVIGGLIRNDDINEMSKVPVLGDLPLFGHLFRHKTRTTDHTEVVMFITASVMKD